MLTDLTVFCFPLSVPSFYLAYRLYRKQFLGTGFNQQIALMLVYSGGLLSCLNQTFLEVSIPIYLCCVLGLVIPLSTAIATFRLLSDLDPFNHQEFVYFYLAPSICAFQRSLETLFHAVCFYGSFVSVLFR